VEELSAAEDCGVAVFGILRDSVCEFLVVFFEPLAFSESTAYSLWDGGGHGSTECWCYPHALWVE